MFGFECVGVYFSSIVQMDFSFFSLWFVGGWDAVTLSHRPYMNVKATSPATETILV